jgi:nitrogen fixation NifU-like protein
LLGPFLSLPLLDTTPRHWDTLSMFSPTLLDHFQSPRNAGLLPNPTAKIEVTNPVCGDVLQLSVLLEHTRIAAVRFLCRGCTASIACASLLTEIIQGRELHELNNITADSLSIALGGLPPASTHAAHLAHAALRALLHRLRPTT